MGLFITLGDRDGRNLIRAGRGPAKSLAGVWVIKRQEIGREELKEVNLGRHTLVWDCDTVRDQSDKPPFFCRFPRRPSRIHRERISVAQVSGIRGVCVLADSPLVDVGRQEDPGQNFLACLR